VSFYFAPLQRLRKKANEDGTKQLKKQKARIEETFS
jgi:hypothetical protein